MFGLTHSESGVVWAKDRKETAFSYGPNHYAANLGGGAWGRIRQANTDGTARGFNQLLNHTGSYDGAGTGSPSNLKSSYHAYIGDETDLSNISLDWSLGNWSATWTARYYSGTKTHCWANTATSVLECSNPKDVVSWATGYNKFGSLTYNDLSVG